MPPKALRHAPVQVVLVDRNNHHLFQPLLYQVATSILTPSHIASPLRQVFRRQRNVIVVQAEVVGVDASRRRGAPERGRPAACLRLTLVLATGAETSYFGRHDDFARYAPSLKSLANAEALRNRILGAFEACEKKVHLRRASRASHVRARRRRADRRRDVGRDCRARSPYAGVGVSSIPIRDCCGSSSSRKQGPRILSMFEEKLSRKAQEHLEKLGVEECGRGHGSSRSMPTAWSSTESAFAAATSSGRPASKPTPVADWLGIETDHTCRAEGASRLLRSRNAQRSSSSERLSRLTRPTARRCPVSPKSPSNKEPT